MSRPERYPWTLHLVWKLLQNDPGTLALLGPNPFPDAPPLYVRVAYYRYEFAPPGDSEPDDSGPGDPDDAWWRRTYLGEWLPPLSASDPRLLRALRAYGWIESSGAR